MLGVSIPLDGPPQASTKPDAKGCVNYVTKHDGTEPFALPVKNILNIAMAAG
ncbi:hypothetical protein [Komagataeibacter xylinus]|uniref:hypothetical protein n=1 Tax=Komagataeibacter xylinus TaxID=28448 RepID=UPI0013310ED6|nr:hypothetical protein [Komagataeibacter xylinus]